LTFSKTLITYCCYENHILNHRNALTILTDRARQLNYIQDLSVEVVYPPNPIGAQDTNTTHQHPLEALRDVVREYGSSRLNMNKIAASSRSKPNPGFGTHDKSICH
jgi:hypothetical protein